MKTLENDSLEKILKSLLLMKIELVVESAESSRTKLKNDEF